MIEEGESARFLVKKPRGPESLTWKAQNVLLQILDSVKRVDSTAARFWALKKIPPLLRESLLHQLCHLGLNDHSVVKCWSILYSSQLYSVQIPSDLSDKSRQTIVQYLVSPEKDKSIPTLIFKVAGANTQAELETEFRFLQRANFLSIFVHRKGATDEVMKVLGESCPCLQEINITGSNKVTDQGIAQLFGYVNFDEKPRNNCAKTLKFMKMRSTGVRVFGVRILLYCAVKLQGVRCSSYDVLQALVTQLKHINSLPYARRMSLRYLDLSNCFAILSKYLILMPDLIEIRIGSDAPPQMRQTSKRLLIDDSHLIDDANALAAIEHVPKLKELKTLVLKAFNVSSICPLLQTSVGFRLRRLDLHYNYRSPGVDLIQIGLFCPFLNDLSVADSLVTTSSRKNGGLFKHLNVLKLLRVSYSHLDDWEKIPRMAKNLRIIFMESSRGMSDSALQSILIDNPLKQLEEFLISGPNNRLSSKSVVRLTSLCSNLRWIGDLRDWNINSRERNLILPKMLFAEGWGSTKSEPKDELTSLGMMFEENTHLQGLSVHDSFDILTRKL